MEESSQEQQTSWTRRAVGASYAATRDAADPGEALAVLCSFGKEVALESARRQAMGGASSLSGESHRERSWLHETEMASLANQVAIQSAMAGWAPKDERLGAFKAFLAQAPWPAKGAALHMSSELAALNPSWNEAMGKASNVQGALVAAYAQDSRARRVAADPDFEKGYLEAVADARLKATHAALGELDREISPAEDRAAQMERATGQARLVLRSIGELRVGASEREFNTGTEWSSGAFSDGFVLRRDDHLASLGRSLATLVDRSGLDPRADREVLAGVSTLVSLMSPQAGNAFLSELGQAAKDRVVHEGWSQPVKRALGMHREQWRIGVAQRAMPGSTGLEMDVSPPLDVDLGSIRPGVGVEDQEARLLRTARASDAGFKAGFAVGGAIKRFVATFERGVHAAQGAVDALTHADPKQWAASAIMKSNELTDRAELAIKAKLARTREQATGAALGAVQLGADAAAATRDAVVGKIAEGREAVIGKAQQGREAFVGKVGELRQATFASMGSVVFKAADALPSAEAMEKAGLARQAKIVKAAAIGGTLLMGVCVIPAAIAVAGVVGGIGGLGLVAMAHGGVKSALEKGVSTFRDVASRLPGALEGLAERLGAKRAMKTEAPSEPSKTGPGL